MSSSPWWVSRVLRTWSQTSSRGGGVGERADEGLETLVEGVIAGFDQSIRVERQQCAFG